MPSNGIQVAITGEITPTSVSDTFAVTNPYWGLGSLRNVTNTIDRDAITTSRREAGMLVYVQSLDKYFKLDVGLTNLDWIDLGSTLGGGVSAGAANGLSIDTTNTILGGTLDRDTEIDITGFTFKFLDTLNLAFYINTINNVYTIGDTNEFLLGSVLNNSILIGNNYDFSGITLNGNIIYSIGRSMIGIGAINVIINIGADNTYTDTKDVILTGFTNNLTNVDGCTMFGNLNDITRASIITLIGDGHILIDTNNSTIAGVGNFLDTCESVLIYGNSNNIDNILTNCTVIGSNNTYSATDNKFIIGNSNKNIFIDTTTGNFSVNQSNPTASAHITSTSALTSNFAFKIDTSSNAALFYVKNDAFVGIGNNAPTFSLDILRTSDSSIRISTNSTGSYNGAKILMNVAAATQCSLGYSSGSNAITLLTQTSAVRNFIFGYGSDTTITTTKLAYYNTFGGFGVNIALTSVSAVGHFRNSVVGVATDALIKADTSAGVLRFAVYNGGKVAMAGLQTGNAGLSTGDLYVDTAANILANGDRVVGRKV